MGTNVRLPKIHRIPSRSILTLQDHQQGQSLGTITICSAVLYFPHHSIVCNHSCCECTESNAPNVWHMHLSILLPHEQVCSQTMRYHVSQHVPNTDISEQCVGKLWTILQLIHFLILQIDDHPCMTLRLCTVSGWFCSPVRNIAPHISLHDLLCHMTMKISFRHQVSPWLLLLVIFCSPDRNP